MSFTSTTNYALQKPDVSTEIDTWGDDLNTNWDLVDARMKLNADAAAAASTLAGTKAAAVHVHSGADITSGTVAAARMPAFIGDVTSVIGTATNAIAANAVTTAKVLDANITNAKLAVGATNTVKGTTNGTSNTDISFATIVASGGGLANDSVTNAILNNMAVNTIKGRVTSGTGDPEDLTGTQVLTITGAATTTQLTTATTTETEVAKVAAFTLALTDAGKLMTFSNASTAACTIPLNSSIALPLGTRIDFLQIGAGQLSFSPTGGVTLNSSGTKRKLTGQYSAASLWKQGTDTWYLFGDIAT